MPNTKILLTLWLIVIGSVCAQEVVDDTGVPVTKPFTMKQTLDSTCTAGQFQVQMSDGGLYQGKGSTCTWSKIGGGGGGGGMIGDPTGGDPFDVLFVDAGGNLGEDPNFTYGKPGMNATLELIQDSAGDSSFDMLASAGNSPGFGISDPSYVNFFMSWFESIVGNGGSFVTSEITEGQTEPAMILQVQVDGSDALTSSQGGLFIETFRGTQSAASDMLDGDTQFRIENDFAAVGGLPSSFTVVSQWNGQNHSGFPEGGGRIGVNCPVPQSELCVINPTNPDLPFNTARVVASFQRASGQTADMLDLLDSDGTTVLSDFDASGVLKAAGYESADGSTGVTVSACTSFKNGLCVAGT